MHSSTGFPLSTHLRQGSIREAPLMVLAGRPESTDENGASAVEYGLMIAGVATLIVAVVFLFGEAMNGMFTNTCDQVNTGSTGSMECVSP